MNESEISTRERILLAAIAIINEEGVTAVTTRNVAKRSGANMAALNYYFGTKENLIKQALAATLNQAFGEEEAQTLFSDANPMDAIKNYLNFAFQGILGFPGIVKAHLFSQTNDIDYQGSFFKYFNSFLSEFFKRVKIKFPAAKKDEVYFLVLELMSAILLPGLLPQIVRESSGLDFTDPKVQKKYLAFLSKKISEF